MPEPVAGESQPEHPEVGWRAPAALPALEQIRAEVSVLGVHAGEFDFEVARSCDHRHPSAVLRSRMSTAGLVRFFKATDGSSFTTMDLSAARPTESELLILDGHVRRRYHARYRPGLAETTYQRTGRSTKHKTQRIRSGEHPLDMQSAFLLLRHWRARPGEQGYFYVLLGKDLWRVSVRFEGEETLSHRGKPRSTLRLTGVARRLEPPPDGAAAPRHFSIWLGNTPARVPLRVEGDASFGTVLMELRSYRTRSPEVSACAVRNPQTTWDVGSSEHVGTTDMPRNP